MTTDLKVCSDDQLETMWQAKAEEIGSLAKASWHAEDDKQEHLLRERVLKAQEEQQVIQKEITRRH